jgi:lipopolysaccharide transport protein LptA
MGGCATASEASAYHAQRRLRAQLRALGAGMAMLAGVAAAEERQGYSPLEDTIIARAREAWQSDSGEVMYFSGDLQLRGSRWRISADRARVEGKLADPDRVVVDGSPARIVVGRESEVEPSEGRSQHLEFDPRDETVRLEGGAMIVKGQQSISSETIRYLLARDTFAAGSHGRVRVVTTPK